jgi:hypothetical protein
MPAPSAISTTNAAKGTVTVSDAGSGEQGRAALLAPGETIGRYVVIERIGAGAMGVVYAAHDFGLGRRIALKLVSQGGALGAERRGVRLLREAQALGKLSHPNIVAVHDVGTLRDQLFIAMELVEGRTLAAWQGRPWQEVLEAYLQAGRGLEAAHRHGIVHRDFKPDNALCGVDGRVRVTDFGLARAIADSTDEAGSSDQGDNGFGGLGNAGGNADVALTLTGAALGTPAYMAPEQHLGQPVSARTDQFSFCVALYEAIYGTRPFSGVTRAEILANIRACRFEKGTQKGAPQRIRRVLERGLATLPQDRWASMDELLSRLSRGARGAGRRALPVLAAAVALAGGAGWLGHRAAAGTAESCAETAGELASLWNAERRTALEAALSASGKPYAGNVAQTVANMLDDYASAWREMRVESCQALRRGERSRELATRESSCLDERRMSFQATITLLSQPDEGVLAHAVEAAGALPTVKDCRAARLLALRPGQGSLEDAQLAPLLAKLAEAQAQDSVAQYKPALRSAEAVIAAANAAGARLLSAKGKLLQGSLLGKLGELAAAEARLHDAASTAEAVGADDVAARAWIRLAEIVGHKQARRADGRICEEHARAAVERAGGDDALTGALEYASGTLAFDEDDYPAARKAYERALELYRKSVGSRALEVASALGAIGGVLYQEGKTQEAIALHEQALATNEEILGREHPELGKLLDAIADEHLTLGQPDAAMGAASRALAIREASLGSGHADVARSLQEVAKIRIARGDLERAESDLSRALAIDARQLGADHPRTGAAHELMADVLIRKKDLVASEGHLRAALAISEQRFGSESVEVAESKNHLAEVLATRGQTRQALDLDLRALAILEKALGKDHIRLVDVLIGIGDSYLRLKEPARAVRFLERAQRLCEGRQDAAGIAEADPRFFLARALVESGGDRVRALELAQASLATEQAHPAQNPGAAAEIVRWIRTHTDARKRTPIHGEDSSREDD